MEHFFTSLSKRQTMLLLTAVTFGGSECQGALDFLPEDESDLLKHRAQEMLAIPREKRIPLLVQEIKRLVNARRGQLWAADPAKLADVLRGERPVLVEVLLRAFPAALADAVRALLPTQCARLVRDPKPEVLGILRWKLEDVLAKMGTPHAHFKFSDVLRLQSRELLTLVDTLGAHAIGPAATGLPEEELKALYEALSPDHRQLLQRAVAASLEAGRRLEEKDAREALEPHGLGPHSPAVVRSAGVQKLARGCLAQGSEFAALLLEKYPGEFGRLIGKWVREERAKAVHRGDGGRTEIVHEMEELEKKGLVTKPVRLPPSARPALAAPPKQVGPGQVPRGSGAGPSTGQRAAPSAAHREAPPAGHREAPPTGHREAPPTGHRAGPVLGGAAAPSQRRAPAREPAAPSSLPAPQPRRDWVAERNARKAGLPPSQVHDVPARRDPMAERAARKAGFPSSRPDFDSTDPLPQRGGRPDGEQRAQTSPTTTKPPTLRKPIAGPGTSVARPSKSHRPPGGGGDDER